MLRTLTVLTIYFTLKQSGAQNSSTNLPVFSESTPTEAVSYGTTPINGCTSNGGTCVDWRNFTCYAGVESSLCPGDNDNIRCCFECDSQCQEAENEYKKKDSGCIRQAGTCRDDSNYCNGTYLTGLCGGPNERRCCSSHSADLCASSPCSNGGSCSRVSDSPYYKCSCTAAYFGQTCEELKYFQKDFCKYHINFQVKSKLSQANSTCRELGGSLVMIKNESTQIFLENSTASLYGTGDLISFWIGGYKRNNKWFWEDFSEITRAGGFTKWTTGRPGTSGNGLIISSWQSLGHSGLKWTTLDWLDEDESSIRGYVCEVAVQSTCTFGVCQNGGTCKEIGCHKYCICQQGYGGDDCGTDLLTVDLLSPISLVVNAGENVTAKLNISSIEGPVTIKVWNSMDQYTPAYDILTAIGETDIRLGRMWKDGRWTTYRLEAIPRKNGTSYKKEVSIRIFVNRVYSSTSQSAVPCGTKVTISYTPHSLSLGLEHQIEILNQGVVRRVYPQSVTQHQEHFNSLPENGLLTVKITVCPNCLTSPSRVISFRTTNTEPAQVIRYFFIFKEYDTTICKLIWSVEDFPVTEYQLRTTYRDITAEDSVQATSRITRLSIHLNQRSESMIIGSNYTFSLAAKTCSGIRPVVQSIGQCIIAGRGSATAAAVQYNVASTTLGVLFGLSLLAIAVMVTLYCYRERQNEGDEKREETPQMKKGTQSKPYHTTYFDDVAKGKNEYSRNPDGNPHKLGTAEDRTYDNPPFIEENTARSSALKVEGSDSNGYEIPINPSTDDAYINPIMPESQNVKDSVYHYENFSKAADQDEEEFPEWDDDSFTSHDSDNATMPAGVPHPQPTSSGTVGLANLNSALKLTILTGKALSPTTPTNHKAQSAMLPKNSVPKHAVALKPSISPKPSTPSKPNTPNQEKGQVEFAMKPAPGKFSLDLTSMQRQSDKTSKVPLKPPEIKPGKNQETTPSTQEHNEVLAALARLKPVAAKK